MVKKKKRSFMSKLFSRRILLLIQFIVSIIFFRMYLYIKDVTNEILFDFMWYYFFVMDVKFIAY